MAPAFTAVVPQSSGNGETKSIDKPLSAMLSAANRVVSTYGGYVPYLSSYVGPTSWMLRMGAKLASSFGWSKPLDVSTVGRMVITNNTFQQNCDGFDVAYNLGLFSDNGVAAESGFAGSTLDEMSLDYLLSVPSLISNSTLTTSDVQDALKYACGICPRSMYYTSLAGVPINAPVYPSGGTNMCFLTTPLSYLGNMFGLWHGDIRFTFRFAKTKFHSGRVLCAYNPMYSFNSGTSIANAYTPTDLNKMQFKSEIWDLREGNVFTFDVPYVSPYSYNLVQQITGNLTLTVMDPLVAPSTVSSSIPFAIEVSALPGFEFASLSGPTCVPAPQNSSIYSQAGGDVVRKEYTMGDAGLCIGERITSVKQLISKACPDWTVTGPTSRGVVPWWILDYPTWVSGVLTPSSNSTNPVHIARYLSGMYAYARGTTACDALPCTATTDTIWAVYENPANSLDVLTYSTTTNRCSNSFYSERGPLHLHIPFYSPNSRVQTEGQQLFPGINGNLEQGALGPTGYAIVGADAGAIVCYTRAADDSQLGYFIGTPPLASISASPLPLSSTLFSAMTS